MKIFRLNQLQSRKLNKFLFLLSKRKDNHISKYSNIQNLTRKHREKERKMHVYNKFLVKANQDI